MKRFWHLLKKEDIAAIKTMVWDVNATGVDPLIYLSDSVYIYRKETGQIEIT